MTIQLKLQQVAKYRRGSFPQPYGNSEWYDGEGAMPFVQVADVEEDSMRLKESTKQKISKLAMPRSVFAPKGTVIVTLQGSIGKVAITQYDSYIDRTLGIFEDYLIEINKKYFALQLEKIFSIKKEKARGGTIKTITKEEFSDFLIPVPSLEEQTRIVRILDTFTSAIDNLKEQIAQRRKQYEYYRDQLLDLEGKPGVEMKTLGELCEIKGRIGFRGYTREDQVEKGEGAISLSPGNIINGIIDYNSCTYITWEKYEESPEIMTLDGDIILCKTASVGKVAMVMNLPEKATINPQLVVLKNIKIANKYLYYQLSTFKIQAILKGLAGIGSVPNISQAKLADIKICISSTDEQQRIVSILDTFEASIQNLEAQLEQREKQYEYYRNKLLTFE